MRAAGLAVEARTLPIGDALWVARDRASGAEYPLDYVLERKSVADMLSSIKESGRYEDQKYRLARAGLATVFYLIEGDPDLLPSAVDQKIARSAALSTTVRDGFRVLRSGGVQETFRLYRALTEALRALYAPLRVRGAEQLPRLEAWRDSLRAATAGQTTLHDVWGRALCEVPGLGADGAAAVLAAHPTPAALWRAFDEALRRGGAPAAKAMLVGARAEGAARGLGPEKARRVFQSLFAAGWAPGC
jgi:crossover junction endonuclease MUS81